MRQEQEARRDAGLRALAVVVERGDHGLAGAGRRDDEVPAPAVNGTFGVELVEDLLLERERAEADEEAVGDLRRCLGRERGAEACAVCVVVGRVALELAVGPQGLERARELFDHVREVGGADLDHPLLPGAERGAGEVGRADVGRGEAGVAMKQPCLGVEARAARVVRDLDLGVGQPRERVEGGGLGRAGERGREQPEPGAGAARELVELILDRAHTTHGDERDDRVDAVGDRDLSRELVAERRLAAAARQERRGGERGGGALGDHAAMHGHEPAGRRRRALVADQPGGLLGDERREVIEELRREDPGLFRATVLRKRSEGSFDLAAEVSRKRDMRIRIAELLDDVGDTRRLETARELLGDDILVDALDER